jgi:hypothetical protein
MVVERVRDGRRIAQLFAGEIRGHTRDPLARLSIVDVEDVEGCSGGAFAFGIDETAVARTDGSARSARLADVYVHETQARVVLSDGLDRAEPVARELGLDAERRGADPPELRLLLADGVDAKRALGVFSAVAAR